jgi:beta-ureidopropionase
MIVGKHRDTNGSTFVSGVIDIEALRHHRASVQVTNWLKDVRTEMGQVIYERAIYRTATEQIPGRHTDYRRDVIEKQIAPLQERGIWKAPAGHTE